MAYQIITDSCCDFTADMYQQLSLSVQPLTVTYNGETFPDRNDDSLKEMYDGFRAGQSASTSANFNAKANSSNCSFFVFIITFARSYKARFLIKYTL